MTNVRVCFPDLMYCNILATSVSECTVRYVEMSGTELNNVSWEIGLCLYMYIYVTIGESPCFTAAVVKSCHYRQSRLWPLKSLEVNVVRTYEN